MARILIVDDSPTVRLTLASSIRQASRSKAEILEAADDVEAMAAFGTTPPDVVFLDMILGGARDGLDVLKAMLAKHPSTKIVLVTGLAREDEKVRQGIQLGAFAFLPKPARMEAVRKILNDLEAESGRFGRIR